MIPSQPTAGDLNPGLQMGDAGHPVRIFFWDSTRGAAVMEASGRETTKRTGHSFPAQAQYAGGRWTVTMQVPGLRAGAPFAIAVWNGSQQDRDGRKYFTIWYRAQ
jgi:DMSO reductase family type II enzyme heme b subunit